MHGSEAGITPMPLADATKRQTAASVAPGLGHNGGPPLEDWIARDWNDYCWRRAYKRAWKTPPREIALRRLRRAEAIGMTYRGYQAVILDRGIYLDRREDTSEERAFARRMRKRARRPR
jgi:hypothetical protein